MMTPSKKQQKKGPRVVEFPAIETKPQPFAQKEKIPFTEEETLLSTEINALLVDLNQKKNLRGQYNPKADQYYPNQCLTNIETILNNPPSKIQEITIQLKGYLDPSERIHLMKEEIILLNEELKKISPYTELLTTYYSAGVKSADLVKIKLNLIDTFTLVSTEVLTAKSLIAKTTPKLKNHLKEFNLLEKEITTLTKKVTSYLNDHTTGSLTSKELKSKFRGMANTQVRLEQIRERLFSLTETSREKKMEVVTEQSPGTEPTEFDFLQTKINAQLINLNQKRTLSDKFKPEEDEYYPINCLNAIESILNNPPSRIQEITAQLKEDLEPSERTQLMNEQIALLNNELNKITPYTELLTTYYSEGVKSTDLDKVKLDLIEINSQVSIQVSTAEKLMARATPEIKEKLERDFKQFEVLEKEIKILTRKFASYSDNKTSSLNIDKLKNNYKDMANIQVRLSQINRSLVRLTTKLHVSVMHETLQKAFEATYMDISRSAPAGSIAYQLKKLLWDDKGAFRLNSTKPSLKTHAEIETIYQAVLAVIEEQKRHVADYLKDGNKLKVIGFFNPELSSLLERATQPVNYDYVNDEDHKFSINLQYLLQASQYFSKNFIEVEGDESAKKEANVDELIENLKKQFDEEYLEITLKDNPREDSDQLDYQFTYKGKTYPYLKNSAIDKQVADYYLARLKIKSALEKGDTPHVDYLTEKKIITDNKPIIEAYIKKYNAIQALIDSQLEVLPLLSIDEKSFNYMGSNYPLMNSIKPVIDDYSNAIATLRASKTAYDPAVDYQALLKLVVTNQQLIEKFTATQRSLKRDLKDRLEKYKPIAINGTCFTLENTERKFINFNDKQFPLTDYTKELIAEYNEKLENIRLAVKENRYNLALDYRDENSSVYRIMFDITKQAEKLDALISIINKALKDSPEISIAEDLTMFTWNGSSYPSNEQAITDYLLAQETLKATQKGIWNPKINYDTLVVEFSNNKKIIEEFIKTKAAKIASSETTRIIFFDAKIKKLQQIINNLDGKKDDKSLNSVQIGVLETLIDKFKNKIEELNGFKLYIQQGFYAEALLNLKDKEALSNEIEKNERLDELDNRRIITDLKNDFDNLLPSLTSSVPCGQLRSFFEWINKNVVYAIYSLVAKEPKEYKPSFFATEIHQNVYKFRQELLGKSFDALEKQEAIEKGKEIAEEGSDMAATSCL